MQIEDFLNGQDRDVRSHVYNIPKGRNIISDVYQEKFFALSAEQKNQLAFMNNAPLFSCSDDDDEMLSLASNCQPTLLISMKRMEKLTGFFKKN